MATSGALAGVTLALAAALALLLACWARGSLRERFTSADLAGGAATACLFEGDCSAASGAQERGSSPLALAEQEAVLWQALSAAVSDYRRTSDQAALLDIRRRLDSLGDACAAAGGASADAACGVLNYLRSPAGASELPKDAAVLPAAPAAERGPIQDQLDAMLFDEQEPGVSVSCGELLIAAVVGDTPRVVAVSFNSRGGQQGYWHTQHGETDETGHSLFRAPGTPASVDPARRLQGFELELASDMTLRVAAQLGEDGEDRLELRLYPELSWHMGLAAGQGVRFVADVSLRRVRLFSLVNKRSVVVVKLGESGETVTSVEQIAPEQSPEATVAALDPATYPWFVLFAS